MDKSVATIYVVDDDADVCRALGRLLQVAGYHARPYCSAREFLREHDPEPPGCILMDISMPDLDGLEVQAMLAAAGCRRPIIFLTGNATIPLTVAAVRAGAVDFLAKPADDRHLLAAVEQALQVDAVDRRSRQLRAAARERFSMLTPRECEVLEHLLRGRLNKQIAGDLGTVEKTVKVHRGRLMRKLGVRSVAELMRLAAAADLFPEPLRDGCADENLGARTACNHAFGCPD